MLTEKGRKESFGDGGTFLFFFFFNYQKSFIFIIFLREKGIFDSISFTQSYSARRDY